MTLGISLLILCLATLPACAAAERQPAAPAPPATRPSDADALFQQIEALKPPPLNAARREDPAYVKSYIKQRQDWAEKRADLAKRFVEKYPRDSRKPDALFAQAQALMRANLRDDEFIAAAEAFAEAKPADSRTPMLLFRAARMTDDTAKRSRMMRQIVDHHPGTEMAALAQGQ